MCISRFFLTVEVPVGADPSDKRVAVSAGPALPLRFGKTFNRRTSRYIKSDGLGPSIGLEVVILARIK